MGENIFSGLSADFVGGRSGFLIFVSCAEGFPGSSAGKESTCNAGDPGSIPGLGRSPGDGIATHSSILGLPCGSAGKESACNAGDLGLIPGLGRSEEGNGYPLQYSGEFQGLYSPWGQKESDTTKLKHVHSQFTYVNFLDIFSP